MLGAILLDHEAFYKVSDKLRPDSFDLPRHRTVYEAIENLLGKQQVPTLIVLQSYLAERGALESVGGVPFLAQLADAVPTAAHVEHHAEIVRQKALARALIRTCEGLAERGYDGAESPSDLVSLAEAEILQIAMGHVPQDFISLESQIEPTLKFIQKVQDGLVAGASTGYIDLDDLTGGFGPGELIVIAARPSMGKTALALNVARNHAMADDGCVALFSLEMAKRELVLRLLMAESELDFGRFRRGVFTEPDMEALSRASEVLERTRIFIDDSGLLSGGDLVAKARRLHRQHHLTMLIVDYIQLIQGREGAERREQEVAEISRRLKLLSKELEIPVLALSQLNRSPELRTNKRPLLADLRESGAIEQDADVVMFIYRDEVYNEDTDDQGVAEIHVAKQRNGPTDTIKLQFAKHCGRFHNIANEPPPPPDVGFGGRGSEPPF